MFRFMMFEVKEGLESFVVGCGAGFWFGLV